MTLSWSTYCPTADVMGPGGPGYCSFVSLLHVIRMQPTKGSKPIFIILHLLSSHFIEQKPWRNSKKTLTLQDLIKILPLRPQSFTHDLSDYLQLSTSRSAKKTSTKQGFLGCAMGTNPILAFMRWRSQQLDQLNWLPHHKITHDDFPSWEYFPSWRLWSQPQAITKPLFVTAYRLNHVDWPPIYDWFNYYILQHFYIWWRFCLDLPTQLEAGHGTTAGIGDARNEWEWLKHIKTIEILSLTVD